jgi:hypothetical protein
MDRQCPSCGGFCKKSGCERESVKPEPEPVAWGIANTRPTEKQPLMMVMLDKPEPSHLVVALYTAPPQREWVGLTEEEYEAIRYGSDENGDPNVEYELFDEGEYGMEINIYVDDFYRAIEAKLREKNT